MEMRAGCGSDRNGILFMKGFIAIFYVPQKMISSDFLCASKNDFLPFTSLVLQVQYAKSSKKNRAYAKTKRPASSILYKETNHFFFFLCR